jgi:hypothetical protein
MLRLVEGSRVVDVLDPYRGVDRVRATTAPGVPLHSFTLCHVATDDSALFLRYEAERRGC